MKALTDQLSSECRLLHDLASLLRGQRDAVARRDFRSLEDNVYSIHRVLRTLGEARRRRRSINRALGESDDLAIRSLETALGARMTDDLRRQCRELERLAWRLELEVRHNGEILREALGAVHGSGTIDWSLPRLRGVVPGYDPETGQLGENELCGAATA